MLASLLLRLAFVSASILNPIQAGFPPHRPVPLCSLIPSPNHHFTEASGALSTSIPIGFEGRSPRAERVHSSIYSFPKVGDAPQADVAGARAVPLERVISLSPPVRPHQHPQP